MVTAFLGYFPEFQHHWTIDSRRTSRKQYKWTDLPYERMRDQPRMFSLSWRLVRCNRSSHQMEGLRRARSTLITTTEDFYRPSTLWQLQTAGNPHRQERPVHPASRPHHELKVRTRPQENQKPTSILNNLISHWICNILLEEQLLVTSSGSGY